MHDIEPYFKWKNYYDSTLDERSPYFQKKHDQFHFTNKIYNYLIHPQWDDFGSPTLYLKILFVDYDRKSCIIELLGEWNDAVTNDIMFLKRNIINPLIENKVSNYVLLCDNVLNFHGSDDCYYEEWREDIEDGWICLLNIRDHIKEEMIATGIHFHLNLEEEFEEFYWQKYQPLQLLDWVALQIEGKSRLID